MSEIRFGVVIPQGWSYDFPRAAETADLQKQIKNQDKGMQYEFSKNISKAVDHSFGFHSIYRRGISNLTIFQELRNERSHTKTFLSGKLSATLIIPIEIARRHGLDEPSHVVVEERGNGILIRRLKILKGNRTKTNPYD